MAEQFTNLVERSALSKQIGCQCVSKEMGAYLRTTAAAAKSEVEKPKPTNRSSF
jgi:hypothetical protein